MPVPAKVTSNSKWPVKLDRLKSISASKDSWMRANGSLKNSSAASKGSLNIVSLNPTPFVVAIPLPVVKQEPQWADIDAPILAPPGILVPTLLLHIS